MPKCEIRLTMEEFYINIEHLGKVSVKRNEQVIKGLYINISKNNEIFLSHGKS